MHSKSSPNIIILYAHKILQAIFLNFIIHMQTEGSISLGVNYNQAEMQLDDSKAAWLHETAECAEQSSSQEESGNSSFNPQSFNGKQDEDDLLPSQKDSTASTVVTENVHSLFHLYFPTVPVGALFHLKVSMGQLET